MSYFRKNAPIGFRSFSLVLLRESLRLLRIPFSKRRTTSLKLQEAEFLSKNSEKLDFLENMTRKIFKILFFISEMSQTSISAYFSRDIDKTSPRQVYLGFPRILTGVVTDLSVIGIYY